MSEKEMMDILNNSKTDKDAYRSLMEYLYHVHYSQFSKIAFDFVRSNFKESPPPIKKTELVEDRLTGTLYEMEIEEG